MQRAQDKIFHLLSSYDNQAILFNFVFVTWWVSVFPMTFPLLRSIFTQGPSLYRCYSASPVLRPIRLPAIYLNFLAFTLVRRYSNWRFGRISHVHTLTLTTCRALRPRRSVYAFPYRSRRYCFLCP